MTGRPARSALLALLVALACEKKVEGPPSGGASDLSPAQAARSGAESVAHAAEPIPVPRDTVVSWGELTKLLRSAPDSVRAVLHTNDGKIAATLRDGHRYHAVEPTSGALFKLLREVDPAGHILIATE